MDCYLRLTSPLSREVLAFRWEFRHMAEGDEDIRLLMSIPGVGYYTALLVKAEIGEVSRFPFKERMASYSGLVPSTKSSGGVTRHGRITREGSRWLRWALVEAALVHLRYDTPVTRAYHRIAERRGRKTARVASARMLLEVCYSVLRHCLPYYNPLYAQA